MSLTTHARAALRRLGLVPGLAVCEVHTRLELGLRTGDLGQRVLAFFLVEMDERRLHQATGHASTLFYAEDRLDLDRRRTAELLRVGRALLDLPEIDRAFCAQEIGWSKLLELVKVATPAHEAAWLARARALTCKQLRLEVRLSRPGQAPRAPGDRKGLPEVRFPVRAALGVVAHEKLERARQKLAAERGGPVPDAELLETLCDLFLQLEADGTLPGHRKVDASLFRIVLRPEGDDPDGPLLADTDLGPLPVDVEEADRIEDRVWSACIRCDALVGEPDAKTSSTLRRKVLVRDGHRCRCCGARTGLHVHHVRSRSLGGKTRASNLAVCCVRCHSLVHAGLLRIAGRATGRLRFLDAEGRPLHAPGERVAAARLLALDPWRAEGAAWTETRTRPPATDGLALDDVPAVVDGAWWRRNAPLVRFRKGQGLELVGGRPLPAAEVEAAPPSPAPDADAFAGLVGQERVVGLLEAEARASRERAVPFPHALFTGPPGTGKTTLAHRVAARLGARLHLVPGPPLEDATVLVRLLAGLQEGDVLFLDEVHAVARPVLEMLYEALTDGCVTLTFHQGARARTVRLHLPAFTLLAATSEEGEVPDALWSRFGLREPLGWYPDEDLEALLRARAAAEGLALAPDAARRLARQASGTPREALRLLERVRAEAAGEERAVLDLAAVERALACLGYDAEGLDPLQHRVVAVLRESPEPVSLARLARALGTSPETLERRVEPELWRRGLIDVTPQGRIARVPEPAPAVRRTSGNA